VLAALRLSRITLVWGTNWPLFKDRAGRAAGATSQRHVLVTGPWVLLAISARARASGSERQWPAQVAASALNLFILRHRDGSIALLYIPSGHPRAGLHMVPLWVARIGSPFSASA